MSTSLNTSPRSSISKETDTAYAKSILSSSSASLAPSSATVSSNASSKTKSLWETVKRRAQEHHKSVNSAYHVYYGQGYGPAGAKKQEIWEYKRGGISK